MWSVQQTNISMAEGDYGVQLPVMVSGTEFTVSDTLKFVFKNRKNGTVILEKEYVPTDSTVSLELTQAESALFSPGVYVYSLDWYQNGNFLCNIVPLSNFKVVDKA